MDEKIAQGNNDEKLSQIESDIKQMQEQNSEMQEDLTDVRSQIKNMAGKMNTQLDKTHSLIQQTNSSLSVVAPIDNDDKINAKIAAFESKLARLEATFGN